MSFEKDGSQVSRMVENIYDSSNVNTDEGEEVRMARATRVVLVTQRKGGVGKTTVSLNLAVQAELSGDGPVALIDLDPSRSLSMWFDARKADTPILVQPKPSLSQAVETLRNNNFGLVMIDTANSVGSEVIEAVRLCDLALVPTQASPPDLRAVGATVKLVTDAQKPMVFLLNRVKPNVTLNTQAVRNLRQYGAVTPIDWGDRVDFGAAQIDGRTIMELSPNSKGAKEVEAVWRYLRRRMANYGVD